MGRGEGRQDITLIQSPSPHHSLILGCTSRFPCPSGPGKGPELEFPAGADRCSYPCPQLPQEDRQTILTHAHARTLMHSHLSPPSALLKPIVQTGAGRQGRPGLPLHRWGPQGSQRPGVTDVPYPSLAPYICGLLQAQLVTLGGRGTVRNSQGDPSATCPGGEETPSGGPPSSLKISTQGQA